jgi:hypothetical protein
VVAGASEWSYSVYSLFAGTFSGTGGASQYDEAYPLTRGAAGPAYLRQSDAEYGELIADNAIGGVAQPTETGTVLRAAGRQTIASVESAGTNRSRTHVGGAPLQAPAEASDGLGIVGLMVDLNAWSETRPLYRVVDNDASSVVMETTEDRSQTVSAGQKLVRVTRLQRRQPIARAPEHRRSPGAGRRGRLHHRRPARVGQRLPDRGDLHKRPGRLPGRPRGKHLRGSAHGCHGGARYGASTLCVHGRYPSAVLPRSGGSTHSGYAATYLGFGGGAVRITVGAVNLAGEFSADGLPGYYPGGAVRLDVANLSGSGRITANAGDGYGYRSSSSYRSAGDGRISVYTAAGRRIVLTEYAAAGGLTYRNFGSEPVFVQARDNSRVEVKSEVLASAESVLP